MYCRYVRPSFHWSHRYFHRSIRRGCCLFLMSRSMNPPCRSTIRPYRRTIHLCSLNRPYHPACCGRVGSTHHHSIRSMSPDRGWRPSNHSHCSSCFHCSSSVDRVTSRSNCLMSHSCRHLGCFGDLPWSSSCCKECSDRLKLSSFRRHCTGCFAQAVPARSENASS